MEIYHKYCEIWVQPINKHHFMDFYWLVVFQSRLKDKVMKPEEYIYITLDEYSQVN